MTSEPEDTARAAAVLPGMQTGGRVRTPREQIASITPAGRARVHVVLLDLSTSMNWSAVDPEGRHEWPHAESRRAVAIGAVAQLAEAISLDLVGYGFGDGYVPIGRLSPGTLVRVLDSVQWGGGTCIMPAWQAALADYGKAYGRLPVAKRPVLSTIVICDGEVYDWDEFQAVLAEAGDGQTFAVAVLGSGKNHEATVNAFNEAAVKNTPTRAWPRVGVASFDSVTDPGEVVADLLTMITPPAKRGLAAVG